MALPVPAPLPDWFLPLTRRTFGLGPRPAHAPKPAPAWCLQEWDRFRRWNAWKNMGGPRPAGLWARVPQWAWLIRRELLAAGRVAPPPPKPAPPPPSVWPTVPSKTRGRNGLYYYNLFDVDQAIRWAQQHDLWIGVLVNETHLTPYREGARLPESYIFGLRDRIKGAGVTCVATGWAEPFGDLDAQANFIGHMAQGFDEYMLNIEAAWVWEAGLEAFGKSAIFAPKVRAALGPNMPLSVCQDWGNNIHWKPWLEAGMSAARTQCYVNEWPHKTPIAGLALLGRDQGDLIGGVPKEMREVVYGKYSDGDRNRPLSTWTPQDDEAGRPPRSVWAAEFCQDADAAWVAR